MASTGNAHQSEASYALHRPEASLPTCDGCGRPVAPHEAHWIYTTDHARCVPAHPDAWMANESADW